MRARLAWPGVVTVVAALAAGVALAIWAPEQSQTFNRLVGAAIGVAVGTATNLGAVAIERRDE